ncbi:hypothetical protein FFF34_003510 [Inquilinus sp. KBS0705]|nr:hypothetical protein FFF34_003510 [Inquilinus sp. KBS0705]
MVSKIEIISQTTFIKTGQVAILNQQDFVIFDELTSFKELMAFSVFSVTVPKVIVIHDCNSWFKPTVPKGLKNFLKYTFTRIIKQKFNVFAVAGSNMKRYLQQNYTGSNVFLIPFRYADFDELKDTSPRYVPGERIRICVPGTISNRRDYDKLLNNLCVHHLKDKLLIDILGKAIGDYGARIIDRIKVLNNEGFKILFNEGYINNDSFDESIKQAHIILSDFEPEYVTNNGQKETYGISKETGVPVLMLNKAKVGLLPACFNQMLEIVDQTLFFDNGKELAEILVSIYTGTYADFNKLQQNAVANAKKMDIGLISKEIETAYQVQLNAN